MGVVTWPTGHIGDFTMTRRFGSLELARTSDVTMHYCYCLCREIAELKEAGPPYRTVMLLTWRRVGFVILSRDFRGFISDIDPKRLGAAPKLCHRRTWPRFHSSDPRRDAILYQNMKGALVPVGKVHPLFDTWHEAAIETQFDEARSCRLSRASSRREILDAEGQRLLALDNDRRKLQVTSCGKTASALLSILVYAVAMSPECR